MDIRRSGRNVQQDIIHAGGSCRDMVHIAPVQKQEHSFGRWDITEYSKQKKEREQKNSCSFFLLFPAFFRKLRFYFYTFICIIISIYCGIEKTNTQYVRFCYIYGALEFINKSASIFRIYVPKIYIFRISTTSKNM